MAMAEIPPSLNADIDRLVQGLEGAGFTVQEGKAEYVDIFAEVQAGVLSTCNGNNAANPYLTCEIPPAPGETEPVPGGVPFSFQLYPAEAVVWVGLTPPEMGYFSYRSYMTLRRYPGQSDYVHVYNSLGDTVNMAVIKTSATPGGQGDAPFNATTMIITVSDNATLQNIMGVAENSGFPEDVINVDVLPYHMLNMGTGDGPDVFSCLLRTAQFADSDACWDWINNPPMRVLRVSPGGGMFPQPMDTPRLKVRGTGRTEMDLSHELDRLRQAIIDAHPDLEATDLITNIWLPEGYENVQTRVNGLGEDRDTPYFKTEDFKLSGDGNDFVVVYGVNHAQTGKATYSSFTVYCQGMYCGVAGVSSSTYTGSARKYLGDDNPLADRFYAWTVSRGAGEDTLTVPTGDIPYAIPVDHEAFVAFRAYLEPETAVGPTPVELLFSRAIHFKAKGKGGSSSGCGLGSGEGAANGLLFAVLALLAAIAFARRIGAGRS